MADENWRNTLAYYMALNDYVYRDIAQSTFIVVQETLPTNDFLFTGLFQWPCRLFVLTILRPVNQREWHLFCPYCKFRARFQNINSFKQKIIRDIKTEDFVSEWARIKIPLLLPSENYGSKRSCLSSPWNRFLSKSYLRRKCDFAMMVMEAVTENCNVSALYKPTWDELINMELYRFGFVNQHSVMNPIYLTPSNEINAGFAIGQMGFRLIYCDHFIRSEVVSLGVWLQPFQLLVWIYFGALILGLAAIILIISKPTSSGFKNILENIVLSLLAIDNLEARNVHAEMEIYWTVVCWINVYIYNCLRNTYHK